MKKLLPRTFFTLVLCSNLHASPVLSDAELNYYESLNYSGFGDENVIHPQFIPNSTLGRLAYGSDVIGVGLVSDLEDDRFTVTVDHALVGCTNGASIILRAPMNLKNMDIDLESHMPTNHSRIVFAGFTGNYFTETLFIRSKKSLSEEELNKVSEFQLYGLNRSWWYANRDDGVLFTQFTNIMQVARFKPNWKNFFYLCRDSANSTSDRLREDSFWDLRSLIRLTGEQTQFILNDPLVDQKHKDFHQFVIDIRQKYKLP